MQTIYSFDISKLGSNGDYGGIGSRRANNKISKKIFIIGFFLCLSGRKLHTGGAPLSDLSFEKGHEAAMDFLRNYMELPEDVNGKHISIYLGWNGFNNHQVDPLKGIYNISSNRAIAIAKEHYPKRKGFSFDDLSRGAQALMSRNTFQVLTSTLENPVKFIVCYTPDGAFNKETVSDSTGGTGQAIRLADAYGVPVFNISNPEHGARIDSWIEKIACSFKDTFGIDAMSFASDYYDNYEGFQNYFHGDLFDNLKDGDVLVHGCNIHNVKGSAFAKEVYRRFPDAYKADQSTRKGDVKKLGKYTSAEVAIPGGVITVVNAYTQKNYGRDENELYCDYEAIRKSFKSISGDFGGRRIVMPKIGSGLANGCWMTISNIIEGEFKGLNNIVCYDNSREMSYLNNHELESYAPQAKLTDRFAFFFHKSMVLSQHHPSVFHDNGITYDNAEKYMMHQKALLFGDKYNADKILDVQNDPQKCKMIGRDVKGFNQKLWDNSFKDIIFRGSILKYSQNPEMLKELLKAGAEGRSFVEASPYDGIYGIKMDANHADANNPSKWKGRNELGKCLDETMEYIINNPEILCDHGRALVKEYRTLYENGITYSEPDHECYEQQSLFEM